MKKYRKKPVVIEAVQWTGNNVDEVFTFGNSRVTGIVDQKLAIHTLEGIMTADLGDYIIKGIKGEFYPCKPDIFEASYEEVE